MREPFNYNTSFLTASACNTDADSLVDLCLKDLSGKDFTDKSLGFLYATSDLEEHLGLLLERLKEKTSIEHWVGTCGFGVIHNAQELYEEGSISVMLTSIPEQNFRVFAPILNQDAGLMEQHGAWLKKDTFHFGLVHADPRNMRTSELLNNISEASGNGFLVGGLTVGQAQFPQITDKLSSSGVGGVLFNSNVPVQTSVSQGCEKTGQTMTVTDSIKNIVVQLDDRPALDVLMETGKTLGLDSYETVASHVLTGLPITGSDTKNFLVRPITGIDPDNKLFSITEVTNKGDLLHFCHFGQQPAIKALEQDLQATIARLNGATPKGAIYISCGSRGKNLFSPEQTEISLVQKALGNIPMVGFFANGEIAANRLHSFSSVLTLFL